MSHPPPARRLVVTGTDTGIGKTVVSAVLCAGLGASYWKPVQSGLEDETDSQTVARLAGVPVLPEAYRLRRPASPHIAAAAEGVTIDPDRLRLPACAGPLIVEGAGGVLVPLTRDLLFRDLFARWQAPVVVVARTQLGTINHTGLSVLALREVGVHVAGVIFSGPPEPQVEADIAALFDVPHLGRMPVLPPDALAPGPLAEAARHIDLAALRRVMAEDAPAADPQQGAQAHG